MGLPVGVEAPVLAALEEVDLAVPAPDEHRPDVDGDPGKALTKQ